MKFLPDFDILNQTVLLRLNLNVSLDEKNGIVDDFRIKAVLPTINFCRSRAKKTVIIAHLGRPDERDTKFSFQPVADYLQKIYSKDFSFLHDCVGEGVKTDIERAPNGSILLLENVRFHKGEVENDQAFGKALSELADVYINDAFGDTYKPYASVTWPPHFMPAGGGLRLKEELAALDHLRTAARRPFVVIIGGVKIKEKMGTILELGKKADSILLGGGVANTMLAALGTDMQSSLVHQEEMSLANELYVKFKEKIHLPEDIRSVHHLPNGALKEDSLRVCAPNELVSGEGAMDIGPVTLEKYTQICGNAADIFWAGPLGYIEWEKTAESSLSLMKAIAEMPNYSVVGGGETSLVVKMADVYDKLEFVSTGGSAALRYLSGEDLPGLVALR